MAPAPPRRRSITRATPLSHASRKAAPFKNRPLDDNVRAPRCGRFHRAAAHCHYSLLTFLCKGRPRLKNQDIAKKTGCAMTMAAVMESRPGTETRPGTGRIARVEIID